MWQFTKVQLEAISLQLILQQMINEDLIQLNSSMLKTFAPLANQQERTSLLLAVCYDIDQQEGLTIFSHYDNDGKYEIVANLTNIIQRAKKLSLNQQQTSKLLFVKQKLNDIISSCCTCKRFERFLKEEFLTFKGWKQPLNLLFTGVAGAGYFFSWITSFRLIKAYTQIPALLLTLLIWTSSIFSFFATPWKDKKIRQIQRSYQIHLKNEALEVKGVLTKIQNKQKMVEDHRLSEEQSVVLAKFRAEKAIKASFINFLTNIFSNEEIKQSSSPSDIYTIFKKKTDEQRQKFNQNKRQKLRESWESGNYEELMNLRKTYYLLEREQLFDTWRAFFLGAIDRNLKTENNIREVLSLLFNSAVGVTKMVTYFTGYDDSQNIAQISYFAYVIFLIFILLLWLFSYWICVPSQQKSKPAPKNVEKQDNNNKPPNDFSNQVDILENKMINPLDDTIQRSHLPQSLAKPPEQVLIKQAEIKVIGEQKSSEMIFQKRGEKQGGRQIVITEID